MVKRKTHDRLDVNVHKQSPEILDEYRGMGGSYVIDPATGRRARVSGPKLDNPAITGSGADKAAPQTEI